MLLHKRYLLFIVLTICLSGFSQSNSLDYFGLTEPGETAEDFNPSVLNLNGSFIFNAIYNIPVCDEFYFTKVEFKENIYFSRKVNDKWQSPQIAPFSIKGYHDADPFFALDGNRVFFVSSRPTHSSDKEYDYNIMEDINFKPEGAESWKELNKRAVSFIKYLIKKYKDKTILVVGHKGPNRLIINYFLKKPLENHDKILQDPANLTIITIKGSNIEIKVNDVTHLKGLKIIKEKKIVV